MNRFGGAVEWVNSEPLAPADLRGHVVLVDFWTLTCINWLRTAPYVRAWADAYRSAGLIVVGVHTPEFAFEREIGGVRRAVAARGIGYPVAVDSDYEVWNAFENHYWPALYFVDTEGDLRDQHFGEGRYEQSERMIQRLLGVKRDLVRVEGAGVEAEADWRHLRTPETYLGYGRRERYADGEPLRLNHWNLDGEWTVENEFVAPSEAGGSIAFRFHARDVHLVLSPGGSGPIPFRVLLDGAPPARSHGGDIDENGHGLLEDGRLYQLIRTDGPIRDRTVEITFQKPGAEAYAFTFG